MPSFKIQIVTFPKHSELTGRPKTLIRSWNLWKKMTTLLTFEEIIFRYSYCFWMDVVIKWIRLHSHKLDFYLFVKDHVPIDRFLKFDIGNRRTSHSANTWRRTILNEGNDIEPNWNQVKHPGKLFFFEFIKVDT